MKEIVFQELIESIRKQDDLVHSWTKTLLAVEGGCVAALAYILKGNGITGDLVFITIYGVIVVGAVGSWVCCQAIESDLKWQGQLITYVQKIDSTATMYKDVQITIGKRGKQANLFHFLNYLLMSLWVLFFIFYVYKS